MARPKKDNKLMRVTVSVDPSDYRRIEEIASSGGLSAAWMIRQAMKEFLERHENAETVKVGIKGKE